MRFIKSWLVLFFLVSSVHANIDHVLPKSYNIRLADVNNAWIVEFLHNAKQKGDSPALVNKFFQTYAAPILKKHFLFESENFKVLFYPGYQGVKYQTEEGKMYFRDMHRIMEMVHYFEFNKRERRLFDQKCWRQREDMAWEQYNKLQWDLEINLSWAPSQNITEKSVKEYVLIKTEQVRLREFGRLCFHRCHDWTWNGY